MLHFSPSNAGFCARKMGALQIGVAVAVLSGAFVHAATVVLPTNATIAPPKPAQLVKPGTDGKLVYTAWSARGDVLPDFSAVGYHEGKLPIPDVMVKCTVNPGSPSDGNADDAARIQAAIDQVAALPLGSDGFRGAVLLKKGRYNVGSNLIICTEGVVLRGEGQGENDTVLVATAKQPYELITLRALNPKDPRHPNATLSDGARREVDKSRVDITDAYVPLGAHSFNVSNAGTYRVGDEIIVFRPSTAAWIAAMGMDKIPAERNKSVVQWAEGEKTTKMLRRITTIDGKRITVQSSITDPIDASLGRGCIYKETCPVLRHVGVEDLRLESLYANETDEKHGWIAVSIKKTVVDAWVRRVTSRYFGYSCVNTSGVRITVMGCSYLDGISKISGGRRYAFCVGGSYTLVRNCLSVRGRHDFVFNAEVPGPNVFLDCVGEDSRCNSEPHQRWATGGLYDNVSISGPNGFLSAVNRGDSGSGHGWAGGAMVFWNSKSPFVAVMKPPTSQNFAIGVKGFVWDPYVGPLIEGNLNWLARSSGKRFEFDGTPFIGDGYKESPDGPVTPASLYWAQYADRYGAKAAEAAKQWK